MKRRVALLLLCGLVLSSCNRGKKRIIGVVPKATSHLFWQAVQAGAQAAGKEFDVEVLWNGPAQETDYSRQVQIVDSLIARRVDGIALAATDRIALVQPLDRAMASGIPVTIFDSGLDSTNYVTFVTTNNYEAGKMAARKMAELLSGKGNVALVLHMPGSYSTMERERGFEDVIPKEFPAIRIVARQYGMSDRAKSRAAAENILAAHPDLDGVFCSTEPSSTGTSLALKAREMAGKVKFVAFDSSENIVADLKQGTIHAMVVQDPFLIGHEAVRTLVDKLSGKTPPKLLDLSGRVITKADLDNPDVRRLLFPEILTNPR